MALISFSSNFEPLDRLLDLQRELDRFLRHPMGFELGPSAAGVYPPVNVFASQDGIVVRAEIPGIEAEGVHIEIEPRRLTISGERPSDRNEGGSYHRRERQFGRFSRTIQLPADLDAGKATAGSRNGVLTVRVPKLEAAKPRHIKIATA